MSKQRTFSIIKPDAVAAGHTGEILSTIEGEGFKIVALRMTRLSRLQAEAFLCGASQAAAFLCTSLVKFMTEGPIVAVALERNDAVAKLREIMGASNPAAAMEGTDYASAMPESIERNCIHGSDAPETAEVELAFFFSTLDLAGISSRRLTLGGAFGAWAYVMEVNQVDILAFTVLGDLEQINETQESRCAR